MKKVIFVVILVVSFFAINNLVRSIYTLWQKSDLLVNAQKELDQEKSENERLKSELVYIESDEFVEEIARNKLLMVKPGEQGIIITEDSIMGVATPSGEMEEKLANWEKWWMLFF